MKKTNTVICFRVLLLIALSYSFVSHGRLKRASAGRETVKNKLYPKNKKIEFSLPLGTILNQALVNSLVVGGSVGYYFNEQWGLHFEYIKALNTDRPQRHCLENFYNDNQARLSSSCSPKTEEDASKGLLDEDGNVIAGANFGPAYLGIREIDSFITAAVSWNPIYGKQLSFMSLTNRFDIFLKLGIGVTLSDYYKDTNTAMINGKEQTLRGVLTGSEVISKEITGCPKTVGICPDSDDYDYKDFVGEKGRPKPSKDKSVTLSAAIGQKIHFAKYFNLKAEIRNYTLFDTQDTVDNLIVVWIGLGARLL
jgi:outer membrane beta-barrel protein